MWESELCWDQDKEFLLSGIKNGFRITDNTLLPVGDTYVEVKNHKSSLGDHKDQVEKELLQQIQEGYYVLASERPLITSPLGAIEKPGSNDIRIIHDGSMKVGHAMNDYATPDSVKYESLQNALDLAKQGYYLAKVDLKSAYRSVPIHKECYPMTGLKWHFAGDLEPTYMFDTRLPFGSRLGPGVFSRLSQAVKRMMGRRGYKCLVVYLDDFFIAAKDYKTCRQVMQELIILLRNLGFRISWKKVSGPAQKMQFLGINIDTVKCEISLRKEKLDDLHQKLTHFINRCRSSKKQLQSLAGLLNWAVQVVRGGKFFLRRICGFLKISQGK